MSHGILLVISNLNVDKLLISIGHISNRLMELELTQKTNKKRAIPKHLKF
jgi:hypothetical protein